MSDCLVPQGGLLPHVVLTSVMFAGILSQVSLGDFNGILHAPEDIFLLIPLLLRYFVKRLYLFWWFKTIPK